ncbi:DUF933 domain-containing protein [Ignavibacterium sp.]|uniref:DUF933 domain-containing protein n=1 Tax=Ignavibacterium sp. TaxID=2651167 RepID=UPI0026104B42|nr:DUF933 domain-containing protein [Ignavibacterium sp.]
MNFFNNQLKNIGGIERILADLLKKFIRAEVVHYHDFIECSGSFEKAKELGKWRLEGKEYIVKDGDIISVRHS